MAEQAAQRADDHVRAEDDLRAENLATKIPGWGSDMDPRMRPAVPKEKSPPEGTGAHWQRPGQQIPHVKIHKSPEHRELTPVFGTSCPPRGVSGQLRDFAYKFSEGQNAHWLTLLLADRVQVIEGRLDDLVHLRPYNPIAESGLAAEWRRHGLRSRIHQKRVDAPRLRGNLLMAVGVGALAWAGLRRFL